MFSKLFKRINKKAYLIVFALLGLMGFLYSNRPLSEKDFWNWFSQNSDKYYNQLVEIQNKNNLQQESFSEIGDQLRKVDKNLTFQFGLPDPKTKKAELVISADGMREGIPAVQRLVKSAPKFEKWNIIAFRQRANDFDEIEFNGIKLSRDDIYFKKIQNDNGSGIDFYIKGYDGADDRYIGATFILLDNTIGEYDVMTRIGSGEFHTLQEGSMDGLKPLKDLPKIIDASK